MQGRFSLKTDLASAMGTSRSSLQSSIRKGYLTVPQMNALAEALGSSVSGVMKELASLAEALEKRRIAKLSDDEMEELLEGRQRKGRRQALQGELDEAQFSEAHFEVSDEEPGDELAGPSSRRSRQPQPSEHPPRRPR